MPIRFARRLLLAFALVAALSFLASCDDEPAPTPVPTTKPTVLPTVAPPTVGPTAVITAPVCSPPVLDIDRSLVVHDPAALEARFGLTRTLQKIIASSQSPAPTTPEQLLGTMLASFNQTSFVQPSLNKPLTVMPRTAEAGLSPAALLSTSGPDRMVPIGLFNRFDLAPADGSNCGEYRIVYARNNPGVQPFPRFLIIFEAKLRNPTPAAGLAGCLPVAKFWADLSAEPDAAARLTALENFYYNGLAPFDAVVDHRNYGVPLGQVRSNLFMQQPWVLREHRTSFDAASGAPVLLQVDTVKDNPLAAWFRDPSGLPSGLTAQEQQAFRDHFIAVPVCKLTGPDQAASPPTAIDVITRIGAQFDSKGDGFQSISQGTDDELTVNTDPALLSATQARLAQLGVSGVSSQDLLNRAGAMTCGGCHQFSAGDNLRDSGNNGFKWPAPAQGGFVHIREDGGLSPALVGFFLPRRSQILARFVCDPTPEPQGTACAAPAVVTEAAAGGARTALQRADAARAALLAAARAAAAAPAPESLDTAPLREAQAELTAAVEKARREEQALPGAFVAARRTH